MRRWGRGLSDARCTGAGTDALAVKSQANQIWTSLHEPSLSWKVWSLREVLNQILTYLWLFEAHTTATILSKDFVFSGIPYAADDETPLPKPFVGSFKMLEVVADTVQAVLRF